MRPLVQVQVGPPTNPLLAGGLLLSPGKLDDAGVRSRPHCVRIGGVPGDVEATVMNRQRPRHKETGEARHVPGGPGLAVRRAPAGVAHSTCAVPDSENR